MDRHRSRHLVVLVLLATLASVLVAGPVRGEGVVAELAVPPNGPEQMPVIYVHGFLDDGAGWARDALYLIEELGEPLLAKYARYYLVGPERSPAAFFADQGIPNWAVQWWSTADGDPHSTAEQGYAFLMDAEELLAGTDWVRGTWTAQNRPVPSAWEVLNSSEVDAITARLTLTPPARVALKVWLALRLLIRNTYNDSGRVAPHAQDLLDLLRVERAPGGRLAEYRQVNLITHSMGSLVTRAMLSDAHEAGRWDSEFVANVIYNAPPFGGSTMAHIDALFHEGPISSATFADPRLRKMFFEGGPTLKDVFVNFVNVLLRPIGLDYRTLRHSSLVDPSIATTVPVEATSPLWFAVDALDNFTLTNPIDWEAITTGPAGDALGLALTLLRPVIDGLFGFPGAPGYQDLTPEGGVAHLTSYTTNPDVAQFVTVGGQGFGMHLFPDDPAAVAAEPQLITDLDAMVRQRDDVAVPVGSARLLTETDAFGPRMTLLGQFNDLEHPDMLYRRLPVMGPVWLETLLAPPTTLRLSGTIETLDTSSRYYRVSRDTTFTFSSPVIERDLDLSIFGGIGDVGTVHISVEADRYEYRFWRADGTGTPPTGWRTLAPGARRTFGQAVDELGLPDVPLLMEWRSINQRGGREMIRSAYLLVEPRAPQVIAQDILTPRPGEVHRRGTRMATPATRSTFLASVDPSAYAALTSAPEPGWIIRRPADKALTLTLERRGTVTYAWDDPTLSAPTTVSDTTGVVIPLDGLSAGAHTLYFETANALGERSPRQRIHLLVDDRPPVISLGYHTDHTLTYTVGPNTPLRFDVQDLETEQGTGTLTVPGHPDGSLPSGRTFTLGETDLADTGRDAGLDGAEVTLTATATDLVGNQSTREFTLFYDWTPPELVIETVDGAVAAGEDLYRAATDELTLTVRVRPAHVPQVHVLTEHGASGFSDPFELVGTDTFRGQVRLAPGRNDLTVTASDVVGNVATYSITVEYLPDAASGEPVELLSPRLPLDACYDEDGNELPSCTLWAGNIQDVVSDFYGTTFVFASAGSHFEAGDNNLRSDVFAWRDGRVWRISETADGRQATGGDSNAPAISGNGRYAVFRSQATNLVPGVTTNGANLYLKDLDTGRIALISRDASGAPADALDTVSFRRNVMSFSGRYVFFQSKLNDHVAGFTDTNGALDIFVVDLDPDGDGDLFEDDYVTTPISVVEGTTRMGNGASQAPHVSVDGRHLVFETKATDLGPTAVRSALASNGSVTDVLLVSFAGCDLAGGALTGSCGDATALDLTDPTFSAINYAHFLGEGGTLTPTDAKEPRVHPLGDVMVLFTTRSNIQGTGDTNSQSQAQDVYVSHRTGGPGRFIEWISHGVGGSQSSETISAPISQLSVALEPSITSFTGGKKSWVSTHDNIVADDTNGVADLFIRGTTTASDLPVINWVEDDPLLPSSEPVTSGGITPDGRYAYWVSTQSYRAPYGAGSVNLYRRRIEPPLEFDLDVTVVGEGRVTRTPEGTAVDGGYRYTDTDVVTLRAEPDRGHVFEGWEGVDRSVGPIATVAMHHHRSVIARFRAMAAPISVGAEITTAEDSPSTPVRPSVVDPDPDDQHTFTILTQPAHGTATVAQGLLVYTPDPEYAGPDSFTIRATDRAGLTVDGSVSVTVTPVPDPPTVTPLTISTTEDEPVTAVPAVTDADPSDHYELSVLAPPAHGTVAVTSSDGKPALRYTPASGYHGPDSFTFQVRDSFGETTASLASVEVRMRPRIPPTADAGGPYTAAEEASVALDASRSSDPDGAIVTYRWDTDGDGQFDDATGVRPSVRFDDDGVWTVRLQVTDDDGLQAGSSATVSVRDIGIVDRQAGTDRYRTAMELARRGWTRADDAVLVTGEDPADALAGAPLAAQLGAPLLLTPRGGLPVGPEDDPDALPDLLSDLGVRRVWILGGPAAVSETVEDALATRFEVRRIWGRDRFATAAAVAAEVGLPSSGEVAITLGAHTTPGRDAWPDALSAIDLTVAGTEVPILLTANGFLPDATAAALDALRPTTIAVVGGPAAIAREVEAALAAYAPVTRFAGTDRYDSSARVAAEGLTRRPAGDVPVVFATGAAYPDALAAGALAIRLGGVLVLTHPTDPSATTVPGWLADHARRFDHALVVGGLRAVSESAAAQLRAAITAP